MGVMGGVEATQFFMELRLYKNISEQNKINKTLKNELVLTGTLRETTSVIKPSITIELSNPTTYNYVYIPQFKRYYYINNIISQRHNIWTLELNVDVLMSYKNDILDLSCVIDKQENQVDSNLINDGSYVNQVDTFTEIAKYNSEVFKNTPEYILITAGAIHQ